jgi:hypothetical protein
MLPFPFKYTMQKYCLSKLHEKSMHLLITALLTADAVLWDVAPFSLMMEAASTFELSIKFYQTTWHNIPEDSPSS